jgi:hypothetical protein
VLCIHVDLFYHGVFANILKKSILGSSYKLFPDMIADRGQITGQNWRKRKELKKSSSACVVSQELLSLWNEDNSGTRQRPPLETGTRGLVKDSRLGCLCACVVNFRLCELTRAT